MLTTYRICKTKYAQTAFDSEGAFRFGGRWNTRGTRVIYTAGNLALAALEMLVHLDDDEILLAYSFVAAQIPAALILPVKDFHPLPKNWHAASALAVLQRIGDEWIHSHASVALEVPTAILPVENNYLLNPAHPAFAQVTLGKPQRFVFDQRLRQGS